MSEVDAPATDAHTGRDLEQLQAYLANRGTGPLGAFEHLGLQDGEYQVGKTRKPQAQLVGSFEVSAGAIGKQVELLLLDAVLHVPSGTVKLLVEPPRVKALGSIPFEALRRQVGHHKTRIFPFGQHLSFAHHSPKSTPAFLGAVAKLHKLPIRQSALPGFNFVAHLCEGILHQLFKRRVLGQPKAIIQLLFLTKLHDRLTGKSTVPTHNYTHLFAKMPPDYRHNLSQRLFRAIAAIAFALSQLRPQRNLVAKTVERHVAVTFIVAMKISSLLLAMQPIIGGIEVQNHLLAFGRERFDPFAYQQEFDLIGLGQDFDVTSIPSTGPQLQTIKGGMRRQSLAPVLCLGPNKW